MHDTATPIPGAGTEKTTDTPEAIIAPERYQPASTEADQ
jgi:hypothetical protein